MPAQHRNDLAVEGCPAQDRAQHLRWQVFALKVALGQFVGGFVVQAGQRLDHFLAAALKLVPQLVGHLRHGRVGVIGIAVDDGLALDEVDHAAEIALLADGHLHGHGIGPQPLADAGNGPPKVGAHAVHLVHKTDARHAIAVSLAPDRLRLGLDPLDAVKHDHAAVENAQAALYLGGKVDVSRRVDDVDLVVAPRGSDGRRLDGNAPLAFLRHKVGHRRALVHVAQAVGQAGIV